MSPRAARANPALSLEQRKQLAWMRWEDITRVFQGFTRQYLWDQRKAAQVEFPIEARVEVDAVSRADRTRAKEYQRLYDGALREIDRLQDRLNQLAGMPKPDPVDIAVKPRRHGKREATAVFVASDWHIEERIRRESVNGLNEYDLAIASRRIKWYFENSLKLLRQSAQHVKITNAVGLFLGDFFSGDIHEDVAESCQLGPMSAVKMAQDLIVAGIEKWVADGPEDVQWHGVFKSGNHSRTTRDVRIANEADHSLESFMAVNIAGHFAREKRVRVTSESSYLTYITLPHEQPGGFVLRAHHGHSIRYQGGVGGISVPIAQALRAWDTSRRADLDVMGHWHQLTFAPRFVVNGSAIGYSPYSVAIRASCERPAQAFFLVDSRFGVTVRAPVLLEEA